MKVVLVVGARPNFMKIAPVVRAIHRHNGLRDTSRIDHLLIHTGQHYDYEMSKVFFEDLDLAEPDIHLAIGSGTHAEQTGRTMIEIERVLLETRPEIVVVVGDVNSTLAAALAAAKLHIPVAHVEAGGRSYDRTMPEEINRILTDQLSEFLFTACRHDDENLAREGIPACRVFRVGNVMADSVVFAKEKVAKSDALSRVGLEKGGYALLTLHRPSNVDDRDKLAAILQAVNHIARSVPVVFPAHPRTRKSLRAFGLLPPEQLPGTATGLTLTDPLGYIEFLNLEMNAMFVITDSGGIQVETTVLGIPCLTLLDTPVWPITHEEGTNILVGSDSTLLEQEATRILQGETRRNRIPELWEGKAAERVVEALARTASMAGRP